MDMIFIPTNETCCLCNTKWQNRNWKERKSTSTSQHSFGESLTIVVLIVVNNNMKRMLQLFRVVKNKVEFKNETHSCITNLFYAFIFNLKLMMVNMTIVRG